MVNHSALGFFPRYFEKNLMEKRRTRENRPYHGSLLTIRQIVFSWQRFMVESRDAAKNELWQAALPTKVIEHVRSRGLGWDLLNKLCSELCCRFLRRCSLWPTRSNVFARRAANGTSPSRKMDTEKSQS